MQSTIENDERVMAFVSTALAQPLPERESYIRSACRDDAGLLSEALRILREEEEMGSFLLHPVIAMQELPKPFQSGELVAERFEIVREIGEGGMGVVYEAFDRKRPLKKIAIKAAKPGFQRLLSPELEGALAVRHPNVCLVNEIHTTRNELGDIDFLTMELLDGETLSAFLDRNGKLSESEALPIARQLCAGLGAAHEIGVIHRDLKSANIILCQAGANGERRASITDFGLAGAPSEADDLAGTPQYMAPELWEGVRTSRASDIYALGVVLYEMVADPKLEAALDGDAWKPNTKGLSKAWTNTIARCTAASPVVRPQDADEVLACLENRPSRWLWLLAIPAILLLALSFPGVRNWTHDAIWPPSNVRLFILPSAASGPTVNLAGGILQDVANRISHLKSGTRLVQVVSPGEARNIHVTTAEQAREAHATHALQTSLSQEGGDVVVKGSLVDLATMASVGEISARYSAATIGAIPEALAGTVSVSLGLVGKGNEESLSTAARAAYDHGLYELSQPGPHASAAIPFFREANRLAPRSPLPLASLVEAELKSVAVTKDPTLLTNAQKDLQAAENLNPDSVNVHIAAARLNEATGEYEKAREQYVRANQIEPRNVMAILSLGEVYDKLGMGEKAIETYRTAVAIDPKYYKPYEYLGISYFGRGQYAEAAEQFGKETDRAPKEARGYSNLAASLERIGRYPAAQQALLTLLKIKETPAGLNNMGTLLVSENRDADAIPYYERAFALNHSYIYLGNLGDSNRRLGNFLIARAQYQKAMILALDERKLNPRNADARANLAYFAARVGQKDRALDEINQALRLAHDDDTVIEFAVSTYDALGLRDLALNALTGASPQLLFELAREPDLADFSHDPRFKQLVASTNTGVK